MAGSRVLLWFLGFSWLLLGYYLASRLGVAYLVMQTFLPLPVLLVGRQGGLRAALLLVAAVAGFFVALHPSLQSLQEHLSFLELLILGLILTLLLPRLTVPGAIAGGVVCLSLAMVGFFLSQALYQGVPATELWARKSKEIADTVSHIMTSAGVNTKGLQLVGFPPVEWHSLIVQLLPSLMVINTTLVAWLNVVLARQLQAWWAGGQPDPPLWRWSVPEKFIFVFLAAGFLLLTPLKPVRWLSLNLLLIGALLYFLQGVAVIAAWFARFQIPRVLRLAGYLLMFLNPLFLMVTILGITDLWLDFRRLHTPPES